MPTWTLVLMVFYSTGPSADVDPRGITSIPGYTSESECIAAGVAAMKLALNRTRITPTCIPGPKK